MCFHVCVRYLVCGVCCLHAVGQSSCLPAQSRFAKQPQLILATSIPPPVLSSRLLSSHTRRVTVMSAKGVTFLPNFNHVWLFIWPYGSKLALQPLALHHVAAFPDTLIYLHFLWITPLMVTVEVVTFFSSCGVKSAVISLFLSPFSLPSSFTSSAVFSRTCFLPASISFPSFLPFVSGRLLDAQMRSRAQCTLRTRYGVTVRCLIRHHSHILWFCLLYVLL